MNFIESAIAFSVIPLGCLLSHHVFVLCLVSSPTSAFWSSFDQMQDPVNCQ